MDNNDILHDLNESQAQAVQHMTGPLLVLAGAGSGKTRVITRRVAHLIHRGVRPQHIVAITFTNKAANEMLTRVRTVMSTDDSENRSGPTIATFHAFAARLLRTYGRLIDIDPNFAIFDQGDQLKLIKAAIGDTGALPMGETTNKIANKIDYAKTRLIGPDELEQLSHLSDDVRMALARIYRKYQNLLDENHGLDFNDLLWRALQLFEVSEAAEAIRRQCQYLLIDEYQDTNRAQYLLAKQLTRDSRNICATGDPDQAIYGWRGADLRNILAFQEDFPDATVVKLEKNYRSTGHILGAANSVIRCNVARKDKTLIPIHEPGMQVEIHETEDEQDEANKVVEIIERARAEGIALSEIGVFCRVNSLLRTVEQTLSSVGVPYELVRGVGFFQKREIRDVVAYLRLLANSDDRLALERIINTPTRGIGQQAQQTLKDYAQAHGISLFEAVQRAGEIAKLGRSQPNVVAFADLITRLGALSDQLGVSKLVERTIEMTGLGEHYRKLGDKDDRPDELSPVTNLEEFVTTAVLYESQCADPSLQGFLSQVSLAGDVDSIKGDADRVTLLTMHAAKGLEFSVVIIIAAEEDVIPHFLSANDDMEEERRLFFVALTRAKHHLHICYTTHRTTRGCSRRLMPSRFLKEIDPKVVTGLNLSAFERSTRPLQFVIGPRRSDTPAAGSSLPRCRFRSGQRIYHEIFGHGLIEEIHLSGSRYTASIQFHTRGLKKIVLDLAPVHPVADM